MPSDRQGYSIDAHSLHERYGDAVFNACLRRLGDREEAADVVQDTFLNAWLALRRGVVPETPLAWLLAIARNLCTSRHRASSVRIKTTVLDEAEDRVSSRQRPVETIDLTSEIRRLPERQRRAFLLYEIKGLSHREVAVELGISYAAAVALVFRARRELAESLAQPDAPSEKKTKAPLWGSLVGLLQPILPEGGVATIGTAAVLAPLAVIPFSGGVHPAKPSSASPAVRSAAVGPPLQRVLLASAKAVARPGAKGGRLTATKGAHARASARVILVSSAQASGTKQTSPGPLQTSPTDPWQSPAVGPPTEAGGTSGDQGTVTSTSPGETGDDEGKAARRNSGSQGKKDGPPADPGGQGNGPPADPGGQGNGPPADPGGQGNGPPADPGSRGNGQDKKKR